MVANALDLLLLLRREGKALGVTELSERAGLPKSTVHRLLTTLQSRGFVRKEDETGKYVLGLRLFEIGMFIANQLDVRKAAANHADWFVEKYQEVVHLAVLEDSRVILLDKRVPTGERSNQMIRFHLCLSSPPHATALGKVLLAYSPPRLVDEYIAAGGLEPLTPSTITDPDEFRGELAQIRAQGYGLSLEGFEIGMSCIGAPVFDYLGRVVAAISVSAPTARIAARLKDIVQDIQIVAAQISAELGYKALDEAGEAGSK
jgi:DNA-binding IclR family transcriptional regulator